MAWEEKQQHQMIKPSSSHTSNCHRWHTQMKFDDDPHQPTRQWKTKPSKVMLHCVKIYHITLTHWKRCTVGAQLDCWSTAKLTREIQSEWKIDKNKKIAKWITPQPMFCFLTSSFWWHCLKLQTLQALQEAIGRRFHEDRQGPQASIWNTVNKL